MNQPDLLVGLDGLARCRWAGAAPDYLSYHDEEWGRPIHDDDGIYERLTLEGFQAGLSWLTILRKRQGFRAAFANFVIQRVAAFDDRQVQRLLGDADIVRNRAKIQAAVDNARAALSLPHGLAALVWSYAPAAAQARPASLAQAATVTSAATALARDLRGRGFRFVGPTTAHALMQATGMVDGHVVGCHVAPSGTLPMLGRSS